MRHALARQSGHCLIRGAIYEPYSSFVCEHAKENSRNRFKFDLLYFFRTNRPVACEF